MRFKFTSEPLEKIKTDMLVLLCPQKKKDKDDKGSAFLQRSDYGTDIDRLLGGVISKIITDEQFHGDAGAHRLIYTHGKLPARAVLLIGVGELKSFSPDIPRKVAAKAVAVANEIKARSIAGIVQTENFKGLTPATRLQAFAEGAILGGYKFDSYKDKKDIEPDTLEEIILAVKTSVRKKIEDAVAKGSLLANAMNFVRDLVNTPAKDMTPETLAKLAKEIAAKEKLTCHVMDRKQIEDEKMNLLLAVGAGAKHEPRFIHMTYKPTKRPKKKIAIVGKGVTFDSGGYNLKPGNSMASMKDDMAGAATCLAIMKIISKLGLSSQVDAYIPATENMLDGGSEVPGNIIKARNGKTVEIGNTDCEGRMILADALSYAVDHEPDHIIDMATLTGHVRYALGEIYTAVLGNDKKLIDKYLAAAKLEDEPAWQLPLEQTYKKGLKDSLADMNNTGKSKAGTIVGALFLEEFVGDAKWLHLDIAESAWTDEERDYTPRGGTGSPLRSVTRLISSL